MKTKYVYLSSLLLLTVFLSSTVIAQKGKGYGRMEGQREKIETYKIAYITEKVELTAQEAEKFWPLYNANRDKVEAEREAFRTTYKLADMDIDKMTDQEANDHLDAQLAHEQKMLDMRKAYKKELKTILPPQKILKLIEAEQQFRVDLMRKVSGPNNPPGRGRQ